MPRTRKPRAGSLQFWPRVRARRTTARVRNWFTPTKKLGGFPVYKAGMTHVQILDTHPTSLTKNLPVSFPVTILECPPIKVIGIRTYKQGYLGIQTKTDILAPNLDKFIARKINLPKKPKSLDSLTDDCVRATVLVATQPHKIGFKKTPEILELALGGSVADQLALAKEIFGKEVTINDVFGAGEQVDVHGITRGRGFQGPVKIFGIKLKAHKSEKGRRAPGNVGAWNGPKNWTVPHAGNMGFHQRTELNKWIVKIGDNPDDVQQKGGITHYGVVKNSYVLVKGSVAGTKRRLLTLTHAQRPNKRTPKKAPQITHISQASKQ